MVPQQHIMPGTPVSSRNITTIDHHNIHHHSGVIGNSNSSNGGTAPITIQQRLNGGTLDCPPRKKSRRST